MTSRFVPELGIRLPDEWSLSTFAALAADGDYAFVGGPFGSDLTSKDYVEEPGVPVIRGTNLGGKESRFIDEGFVFVSNRKRDLLRRNLAHPGDLIFTQRGTMGQIAVIPLTSNYPEYVISQSQMKLTVDARKADARYLYYYYRSPVAAAYLERRTQATGVPHINLGILKDFPVLLPPLAEQKRIAAVLDKANDLRGKRRQALATLDTLLQSVFLDMFGSVSHDHLPLESVLIRARNGLVIQQEKAAGGLPISRIETIWNSEIDPGRVSYAGIAPGSHDDWLLAPGDILFSHINSLPHVGKVAIYEGSPPALIHGMNLLSLRPDTTVVDPTFLLHALRQPGFRGRLLKFVNQSVNQVSVSLGNLRRVEIPIPPRESQRVFAERCIAINARRREMATSAARLETLFAALQSAAFAGTLFNGERSKPAASPSARPSTRPPSPANIAG